MFLLGLVTGLIRLHGVFRMGLIVRGGVPKCPVQSLRSTNHVGAVRIHHLCPGREGASGEAIDSKSSLFGVCSYDNEVVPRKTDVIVPSWGAVGAGGGWVVVSV